MAVVSGTWFACRFFSVSRLLQGSSVQGKSSVHSARARGLIALGDFGELPSFLYAGLIIPSF